jgi:uncharacterized protein DUF4177
MSTPWEYKVILSHGISDQRIIEWEEELNRYGAEGWELVCVIVRPEVPREEAPEGPRLPRTAVFLKRERR